MTTPPNTTPAVSPATDEEIAFLEGFLSPWGCSCGADKDDGTLAYPHEDLCVHYFAPRLIARIRQEQERVKERDIQLADLHRACSDAEDTIPTLRAELAAQGDIVSQLHKDLVNANAAIARMKAGHDEIIEARTALRLIPLRAELSACREKNEQLREALRVPAETCEGCYEAARAALGERG